MHNIIQVYCLVWDMLSVQGQCNSNAGGLQCDQKFRQIICDQLFYYVIHQLRYYTL